MTRPVLVFDGDCGFCTSSARFLTRWVDRKRRYAVQPWQRLDLASLALTEQQCDEAVQFVDAHGRVTGGHRAIAAALRHGSPAWRLVGWLLEVPGVSGLAAAAYRWVSQHRHQLPGGTPACSVER